MGRCIVGRRVVVYDVADLGVRENFGSSVAVAADARVLGAHKRQGRLQLIVEESDVPLSRVTLHWAAISSLGPVPPGFTFCGAVSQEFFTWAIFTRIT